MRRLPVLLTLLAAAPLAAQGVPAAPKAPAAPMTPPAPTAASPAPAFAPLVKLYDFDDGRAAYALEAANARLFSLDRDLATLNRSLDVSYARDLQSYALDMQSYALDLKSYALDQSLAFADRDGYVVSTGLAPMALGGGSVNFAQTPRAAWLPGDPGDSLYRSARELLNRGDYRRAAAQFADLAKRFPSSPYAADAPYWQAFSLYRIGGTSELQEALGVLERYKAALPSSATPAVSSNGLAFTRSSQARGTDADALAARIASVLSSRGMADNAAVKRALSARGDACDSEEQSVRSQALSALMQSDPEAAKAMVTRILARRDECSVQLRRSALFLLGDRKDDAAIATIAGVAKNDPSVEVRNEAVMWLGRLPNDAGTATLEEIVRADTGRVQRTAMSVLASNGSPRAKSAMRAVVERNDAPEALRVAGIQGMGGDRLSADDAAWLRGIYGKTTSARVKRVIVQTIAQAGGEANAAWVGQLIRNEDEPLDVRMSALGIAGSTMDIAAVTRMYDGSDQRQVRETLISILSSRKEPAATDKLIEIARTGTDPSMRRMAISALARSKDPRANKLLLELVDK